MTGWMADAEKELREIFAVEWLNSVIFVMDYVQFTFNGPILSAFTWPAIENAGEMLLWDDAGYRDALCALITHHAVDVRIRRDESLTLTFDTGAMLRVSLRAEELRGRSAETAMFNVNLPDDKRWWVFRPGD